MTERLRREIQIYTPNKRYIGQIDIKNEDTRTLDLLNSSNLYWKDPNEKSFSDSILLYNVNVEMQGEKKLSDFKKLQLRLTDIIFFSDKLSRTGDEREKMRARVLSQRANEKQSSIRIITRMRGDSFFVIVGVFFGLFKNKSQQRFLPITQPQVREIVRTGNDWQTNRIAVPENFVGVATAQIEACSL